MKFSDVVKGRLALSPVFDVALHHALDDKGEPLKLSMRFRVLAPFEATAALGGALAAAKAQGVEKPEAGDPIYDEEFRVETLAIACVDPETKDGEEPRRYFDSADEIRKASALTPDVIHFLFEMHELWVDQCSLQKNALYNETAFERVLEEAALGNVRPFLELRPGARWSCFAFSARQRRDLLKARSSSSSDSDASTKSESAPKPIESEPS